MACLDTIAIQEFKDQFFRDFLYLPTWLVTTTYNTGDKVYYDVNGLFYTCQNDGVIGVLPTNITDWTAYTDSKLDYIQDIDITKAFTEAKISFNEALVEDTNGDCVNVKHTFYYLVAHYLVQDIQASLQGLESTGNYNVSARSVGSVSETYSIPEAYTKDPILNYYTKTSYGLKYLNIIYPAMIGNVGVAYGRTTI